VSAPARLGLAAAAAVLLGGCAVDVPFDLSWSLTLAGPQPGRAEVELAMDLTEQELWAQRDAIQSVHPERVELTVVAVEARNRAESIWLALRYRPADGPATGEEDVPLLLRVEVPLILGEKVELPAPEALAATMTEALRGPGSFTLAVEVEAEAPVEAIVSLTLSGSATAIVAH
jgi:hypothetical protein